MRLLTALRLLVKPEAPTTQASQGAVYFDSTLAKPVYHNGTEWVPFGGTAAAASDDLLMSTLMGAI